MLLVFPGYSDRHVHECFRGLDNAGKTTIVKRINGEDISKISPTLGFNIKTMQYNRCAPLCPPISLQQYLVTSQMQFLAA